MQARLARRSKTKQAATAATAWRCLRQRRCRLELVELDARLQQRCSLVGVAGMHRGHVGGGQRVGEHTHTHALVVQGTEGRHAVIVGHEIGRHQLDVALGTPEHALQARQHQFALVRLAKHLVGRVHHQARGAPCKVAGQGPALAPLLHPGRADQRGRITLGFSHRLALGLAGRCDRALRSQLDERVGRGAVPVGVEGGDHRLDDRADGQHIEVGELHLVVDTEVFVAGVAPAHDRGQAVGGERLVVHATVEPREVARQVPGPTDAAAVRVGIEEPDLDAVVRVQARQQRVERGAAVVVVEQQAHTHAALGGGQHAPEQPAPGAVVAPDVALHVQADGGPIDQPQPRRKGVQAALEHDETRAWRLRSHRLEQAACEPPGARRCERMLWR